MHLENDCVCVCVCVCVCFCFPRKKEESKVAQPCLTLCNPMDYSLPGSSVHGILQARILEWVAISSCREACLQSLIFFLNESESEVAQLCPTLCDPMDCSLPGSSIHRIFQARILEWIAISFSRGSSRPMNRTQVSCLAGRYFTIWATRKSPLSKPCALRTKGGVNTVKGGYLIYHLWK